MTDKRDYQPFTHFDTFSGIGGFSLGLERTGAFKTVAFCEKDEFCQKVLSTRWPDVPIFEDIHDVSGDAFFARGLPRIDVLTAGFPCQPFSAAGKKRGIEDKERFLWPELFRVIAEIKPSVVILENSERLLSSQRGLVFAGILYDLFKIGFNAEWDVIPATAFGAPHKRERLWVVAYTYRQRYDKPKARKSSSHQQRYAAPSKRRRKAELHAAESGGQAAGNPQGGGWAKLLRSDLKNRVEKYEGWEGSPTGASDLLHQLEKRLGEPAICGTDDGIPYRMDRLRSLGNAVIPQIPEWIGYCILEAGLVTR